MVSCILCSKEAWSGTKYCPEHDTSFKDKSFTLPRPGDADWDAANPGPSAYKCSECGKAIHTFLNEEYDAYYCPDCNRWNEPACSDVNCWACSKRPEKPL